ncbi:MAG: sensor histidine kinase, partial [Burkholderiaceae bacterium]|nr:sensor histidine kinase [Burkholderiaceae bacterium]
SGIDLGADIPDQTCTTRGSPDQLKVLLNNLVDNALRYTRRRGHVDVRLAIDPSSGAPVLEVIDDGPGIEPWERHRVFDRFYRAVSSQTEEQTIDGTGLGMAIVKSIADHHGAIVTLGNGLPGGRGPGLSVQVRFPATG